VRRPALFVGIVAVAVLAYIAINSLRTSGPGSRGVPAGEELPAFAAPLALSDLEGDANVSDRACDVRGPDVLNVCQLAARGPVVLAFFAEPSERCDDQIDLLDRTRRRFPGVQFAAIAIRGDRDDLRRAVREHGWRLPVAHDRDGAVTNLYGVAVCPATTFAARGGTVRSTAVGALDERALTARVNELVGASRERR
jgi:peroxiredoxin